MSSAQQQPTALRVPLSQAAPYGLLSGQGIAAQVAATGVKTTPAAIPIQVLGRAGAQQGMGAGVAATRGVYAQGSGTAPQALSDLAAARSYCAAQGGAALDPVLAGRTLSGGAYAIVGDATLGNGTTLTLSGDTATVVVLNITGALVVGSRITVATTAATTRGVQEGQTLNSAAEKLNASRYEQVLLHQRELPTRLSTQFLLAEADRQVLREVAILGTVAARSACQLLRFYEPNCQCVLATPAARARAEPILQPEISAGPLMGVLYPNPATETVMLTYHLPAATPSARLVVHDLTGRVVLTQNLKAERGEVQMNVKGLAAGLYVVLLQQQGHVLATRRLAITH